jgi:SnoaL-like polyketide cyclase
MSEENAAIFKRFMVEAFEHGDLAVVDELISPEIVDHQFGLEGSGPGVIEKVKRSITELHGFLHGLRYTFDEVVSVGDTVWARCTAYGTHGGPLFGRPASGRPVKINVLEVCRFKNGQIVEHWGVPDRFAMLAQVGILDELRGR